MERICRQFTHTQNWLSLQRLLHTAKLFVNVSNPKKQTCFWELLSRCLLQKMWGDRVDADIRVRLLNNQWRQRLGMRHLKRPLITRYLASKEQKSIVLATRHLFWWGKNSFMLQKVISNLSRKNRNIYPLLYLYEYQVGAPDSLFTNAHKHSHTMAWSCNKSSIVSATIIVGQLVSARYTLCRPL